MLQFDFDMMFLMPAAHQLLLPSEDDRKVTKPGSRPHAGPIFGGHEVDINRHPYMISLRTSRSGSHDCAAVLVHPAYALAAASCVRDDSDLPYLLYPAQPCSPGALSGNGCREAGAEGVAKFEMLSVSHVSRHPDWTGAVLDGADIAIIYLESPLEGHPTLRVLPQPDPADWEANKKLYVLGWGLDFNDLGASPRSLQGAELLYRSPPHLQ